MDSIYRELTPCEVLQAWEQKDKRTQSEKICIEIYGRYHYKRQRQDAHRDKVFRSHGFMAIRIKNLDACVDVAF